MTVSSFSELYDQLQALFQQQAYLEAFDLATQALPEFPEQRTLLDYWRMMMSARAGDEDQALQILGQALERGQWYSEVLLRRSPSLRPLQGRSDFEALAARNQEQAEQDQDEVYPLYTLRPEGRCQPGGDPCSLLLGLHANMATAHTSMGFWRTAATAGWLVGAVQSSQAVWKNAYVWDDREIAEQEVRRHYDTLIETYAVHPRRTVLAGHSMGGEIAIWMAIKGALPARGFLAIGPGGPWMDNLAEWENLLRERLAEGPAEARTRELRGYIITGEDDGSIPHENIDTLVSWLNRAGIRCGIETVAGVEHDYTPEYDPAILRGLNFLME
ncbi:MAG: alpha/beta hydrolase [Chloroflexota bacterium]